MSEIVFILGAGASKESGAPTMANFLDVSDGLRRGGILGEFQQDFDRVFNARSKLQIVHSKAALDLDNIESVFAAFEMGRLIGILPGIEAKEIDPLLVSIRRLILKTLEQTISYPIRNDQIWPSNSYHQFAVLVKKLVMDGHSCSIITFNYDCALDYALNFNSIPPDYCLPETPNTGVIPLMKLHGSLNWARCSTCENIVPWDIGSYMKRIRMWPTKITKLKTTRLEIGTRLSDAGLKHCDKDVDPHPVIVPPTWNKTEYHQVLSSVWARAASEFSTAENIFVLGYSLNESDLFFRYLFALGSVGDKMIKRFWVFDPDPDDLVEKRFSMLVGLAAETRYRCFPQTFGDAINVIQGLFPN